MIPLAPKYSKMLLEGRSYGVAEYILLLVSALSVDQILNESCFALNEEENYEVEKKFKGKGIEQESEEEES
jgi:HrpA-like RNA helicase